MPILEFKCQSCGQIFERILPSSAKDHEVVCPNCGRAECKRKLSIFSTGGNSTPSVAQALGSRKFT
jgi:putative FmdB family regulatory protein